MAIEKKRVSDMPLIEGSRLSNFDVFGWAKDTNESGRASMSELKGDTGKSAYELWQSQPGNSNKTYEEYLAFNKQPATEAATEVRSDMNGIKTEWSGLKTDVEEATEAALDTANNPTYIGSDNFVYEWNGDEYVKTDVYVKGESGAMVIADIADAVNHPDTDIFLVPAGEPTDLDNWIQNW